ncbi:hypothetical protein CWB72_12685 [Pseudoalteromonas phenolica]|uniref:hypothetical protein n=1 Tax=Pseudoalteromonas phenolica TaxID=161398 RepID=UPI00110BF261|nr:hypothetical protein [Pseudoalteromonas phenolica]TMN88594.1 hypothetical protein CWB72_12685 [Pseudoalteromonas phenolica]
MNNTKFASTKPKSGIQPEAQHQYALESQKLGLQAGLLGKVFGVSQAASKNIAGFIAVLLIATGILTLFIDSKITASEFWELIVPILTMILGYLFGQKNT